jgi:hypothetical protein
VNGFVAFPDRAPNIEAIIQVILIFSSSSALKGISGFENCTSLCQIEIPSSVEQIGSFGFKGCKSQNEIVFSSDSHLRQIDGFAKCTSLCRIEIPSSVQTIGHFSFSGCTSLHVVIIRTGRRPTKITDLAI